MGGLDNNPLKIHSPAPLSINFQQVYLKIPVSTSLQSSPNLLVVAWVTEAPTELGGDAGTCLATKRATNSPNLSHIQISQPSQCAVLQVFAH